MSRVLLVLLGVALGVVASLAWRERPREDVPVTVVVSNTPRPASPVAEAPPAARVVAGAPRLSLDAAALSLVDLTSVAVGATDLGVETQVAGRILDHGALLADRRALAAARDAAAAQRAVQATQRARLERLRALASEGEIAVVRELNALELATRREAENGVARRAEVQRLLQQVESRWGPLASDEDAAAALAADDSHLLEFAAATPPPSTVFVAADENRAAARDARVLGAATSALGAASSATWYALVREPALRVGMRVSVWIPLAAPAARGTLLPAAALVWHGGAQWYYVELAPGSFERRRLGEHQPHDLGAIVADLAPGTRVVTRGAQALLAEELHARIPSEDDD
ncbi:MAG: hypothetical protein AB7I01_00620 [Gammaproteobacteria bacterium]